MLISARRLVILYIYAKFREIISNGYSYGADTNDKPLTDGRTDRGMDGRTDGRTDTQNVGGYNIIPCHFLWRGIIRLDVSSESYARQRTHMKKTKPYFLRKIKVKN